MDKLRAIKFFCSVAEAKSFVAFLQGAQAADIFRKRGFTVIPPATTAKP